MKRRANGEGSITLRPDGRWQGSLIIAGTPRRKYVYGRTSTEVAEQLKGLAARQAAGVDLGQPDQPLATYLTRWYATLDTLRPSTRRQYQTILTGYLIPHLGTIRLSRLTALAVEHLIRQVQRAGHRRTAQQVYSVLHAALDQAVKWGLVSRNICTLVDTPTAPPQAPITFTPEHVQVLLTGTQDTFYGPLWAVAVLTGLRQGELCALRWIDVDFAGSVVQVVAALDSHTRARQDPKTAGSRRTVPLPLAAGTALRSQQRAQKVQRLHAGATWQGGAGWARDGLVFTSHVGGPLNLAALQRTWHKELARLDLPRLPFHGLRRTFASLLHAAEVDPLTIARLLGHTTVRTSQEHYIQITDTAKARAIAKLADLWATDPPQTQERAE